MCSQLLQFSPFCFTFLITLHLLILWYISLSQLTNWECSSQMVKTFGVKKTKMYARPKINVVLKLFTNISNSIIWNLKPIIVLLLYFTWTSYDKPYICHQLIIEHGSISFSDCRLCSLPVWIQRRQAVACEIKICCTNKIGWSKWWSWCTCWLCNLHCFPLGYAMRRWQWQTPIVDSLNYNKSMLIMSQNNDCNIIISII